jgi:AcrR family transcriptional regulator
MDEIGVPKLSRKEREFLRHKEEILWAAEQVFSEKGYVSATVDEIAQRAEFAVGTLYRFFENKSELYSETVLTRMRVMEKEVYAALRKGDSPAEMIRSYFGCRIELFWEYPQFFRLFFSGPVGTICDASLGFLPEIQERYERLLNELRRIFTEGVNQKEFRPYNPDLLTLTVEGALKTYVEKLIKQDNPVRDKEEEGNLFRIFLSGAAA